MKRLAQDLAQATITEGQLKGLYLGWTISSCVGDLALLPMTKFFLVTFEWDGHFLGDGLPPSKPATKYRHTIIT